MSDGKTTYMYRQVIEYADFNAVYLSSLRANSVWLASACDNPEL